MAVFINFINGSNYRYIVPVDSISMIVNTSTSSVSVYFKNGKFSSGSYQETNMHATKTLTNESITLTTTSSYAIYVMETLTKLVARVQLGDYNGYAEVGVDRTDYADFNEITGVALTNPTSYDYNG